jgi:hypothetical protein
MEEKEKTPEELDKEIKEAFDGLNAMRKELDAMWEKSEWSEMAKRAEERKDKEEDSKK